VALKCTGYRFVYVDVDELDITDPQAVAAYFSSQKFDFCINCAAYTGVDKAETDAHAAAQINTEGARILAEACDLHKATLIHISTDFVFSGDKSRPYTEKDRPNPIGVYGLTKLKGEMAVMNATKRVFVLRTSWLYSQYGHNFLKSMIRLGKERKELKVVYDQVGTPTYAGDLAAVIIQVIQEGRDNYGLYHYSNEGVASWYDFARAIFDLTTLEVNLIPIGTSAYPTPARRPAFSVLDKAKIREELRIDIPYWRNSLQECLSKMGVEILTGSKP
jgi:dTDP-4-dehydrorhamnose reductase